MHPPYGTLGTLHSISASGYVWRIGPDTTWAPEPRLKHLSQSGCGFYTKYKNFWTEVLIFDKNWSSYTTSRLLPMRVQFLNFHASKTLENIKTFLNISGLSETCESPNGFTRFLNGLQGLFSLNRGWLGPSPPKIFLTFRGSLLQHQVKLGFLIRNIPIFFAWLGPFPLFSLSLFS